MTSPVHSMWYAVARSEDAVAGEIAPVRLLERDLAVWRSVDGRLNAWEDRCPHRGTRLTLGINAGHELVCRYHGWRFASGSARCTLVPAHPTRKPPQNAVARSYGCVERYGLVWVSMEGATDEPHIPALAPDAPGFSVRSVTMDAPIRAVEDTFVHAEEAELVSSGLLAGTCRVDGRVVSIHYVLQPQSADRTTVHGVVSDAATGIERLAILRAQNDRMKFVRRRLFGRLAATA